MNSNKNDLRTPMNRGRNKDLDSTIQRNSGSDFSEVSPFGHASGAASKKGSYVAPEYSKKEQRDIMKGTTLIFGSGGGKKKGYEGVASLSKAQLERDSAYQTKMGILPHIHDQ